MGRDAQEYLQESFSLFRAGRIKEARAAADQGLAVHPDHPLLLRNRGAYGILLGDETAAADYQRVLELNPDDVEALQVVANIHLGQRRIAEAESGFRRVLELDPRHRDALRKLCELLERQGRAADVEALLRGVVAAAPDNPEALHRLGRMAIAAARRDEAEALLRRAAGVQPEDAGIANDLGFALILAKRGDEAEACFRRALDLRPEFPEAHYNLGCVLREMRRSVEAEAALRRAIELRPDHADAHLNLGNVLRQQGRNDESEASYRRAIELRPDHADAYNNLANRLVEGQRREEAEAAYRRAVELHLDYATAHANLGLLLLSLGRFEEGWGEYEYRRVPENPDRSSFPPPLPADGTLPPYWQGQPLAGKALLVWPEQGYGDEIQFVRYLRLVRARSPRRLVLACKAPLARLLAGQGLADQVISQPDWRPETIAEYDYWCHPLSLPNAFATRIDDIPNALPYLAADRERIAAWAPRLPTARRRVGLVWKGTAGHKNDANRSLPSLSTLAPLWSVPRVAFVSLQKGAGEDEAAAPPPGLSLCHLGGEIADFADSAAIVAQLDLVICVDTAIAHLAGALGRPCWVLLTEFGTDWRWLLEREDSPWYPKVMRLFRQTQPGDWDEVVERVAQALGAEFGGTGAAS